jgi:uncharacterized membrane protein YfcA
VAGFVQGLSGFAFGMVAMSFWAWVLEPQLAAVLSVFGSLTGQIIAAFTVRREFHWKSLLPFIAGGLVGIPMGVAVMPHLNMDWFKLGLGCLLVLWCPTMLLSAHLPRLTLGGGLLARCSDALAGSSAAPWAGWAASAAPCPRCGARCAALSAMCSAR